MRKLVSGLFVSLDGVVQSPDRWQFAFDEEMGVEMSRTMAEADTILLGRVTWTEWSGYWPSVTDGEDLAFAEWINSSPKHVVSTTLTDVAAWPNSHLISGDLTTAIRELKAADGKDITVSGSPGLVRSLIAADLLDELTLFVSPVVAGQGLEKLFADDAELMRLELVGARPTSSGTVIATYRPRR
jgi:dihydrofolate reductase